jgi:hypothetical protein
VQQLCFPHDDLEITPNVWLPVERCNSRAKHIPSLHLPLLCPNPLDRDASQDASGTTATAFPVGSSEHGQGRNSSQAVHHCLLKPGSQFPGLLGASRAQQLERPPGGEQAPVFRSHCAHSTERENLRGRAAPGPLSVPPGSGSRSRGAADLDGRTRSSTRSQRATGLLAAGRPLDLGAGRPGDGGLPGGAAPMPGATAVGGTPGSVRAEKRAQQPRPAVLRRA